MSTASAPTFDEEFNSFHAWDGLSGWDWTGPQWLQWTDANGQSRTTSTGTYPFNNELQWYTNPINPPQDAVSGQTVASPFSVTDGVLRITASSASINSYFDHQNYSSGLITTDRSFAQLYGYFEMRAELPAGNGLLPAFWLLPTDGSHAEIDAMEVLGRDPGTLYTTLHSYATGALVSTGASTAIPDASAGFHTYGVDWEADHITWYFDGIQVFQASTPADLQRPMYMLANLAVGGSWAGDPSATSFPTSYLVDYIRAYSSYPVHAPVAPTGLADAAIANGYVNAAHDTAAQALTGTAEAGSTVTVYDGISVLGTAVANLGAWSFTLGHLADGSHSLTATATDAAGNTGAASAALAFTADTVAPVAPTGVADTSIVDGYVHAAHDTALQALTGKAEAGSTVTVFDGTSTLGTARAGSDGSWSYTLGHLADGSHSLTAAATDPAGNTSAPSTALSFIVDTQAPGTFFWNDPAGHVAVTAQNGMQTLQTQYVNGIPSDWSMVSAGDFNGDGSRDILWRDTSGHNAIWTMQGDRVAGQTYIQSASTDWHVAGTGDFNGDGRDDILWRDSAGHDAIWFMHGTGVIGQSYIDSAPTNWNVAGVGDFNGDGHADILWRDSAGNDAIWTMNGVQATGQASIASVPTNWNVAGVGDFNGDGRADILWRDSGGNNAVWNMNGTTAVSQQYTAPAGTDWHVAGLSDFDHDNHADILWQNTSGDVAIWEMNNAQVLPNSAVITHATPGWDIIA